MVIGQAGASLISAASPVEVESRFEREAVLAHTIMVKSAAVTPKNHGVARMTRVPVGGEILCGVACDACLQYLVVFEPEGHSLVMAQFVF